MSGATSGPVFVFDPQGLVPDAEKLRWNPVKGCEVPQKAILRARGFAGFAGVGAAVDGGGAYWEQVAASIIRSYLHAAALEGLGVEQLLDWSRHPGAREPVRILSRRPGAARGWDEDLAASTEVEPRHRDSIWATVRRAFDCFADPRCWTPPGSTMTLRPRRLPRWQRHDLPDGLARAPSTRSPLSSPPSSRTSSTPPATRPPPR